VLRAARLKTNRVFTTKALSAIKMVLKAYCASHLSSPARLAVFWQFQGCQPVCLLQVCLCGARMSVEPRQPAENRAVVCARAWLWGHARYPASGLGGPPLIATASRWRYSRSAKGNAYLLQCTCGVLPGFLRDYRGAFEQTSSSRYECRPVTHQELSHQEST
jgi:hypothetical protein